MAYFDDSVGGFWKSFFVAVLIAPAFVFEIALAHEGPGDGHGLLRLFLVNLLAYSLSWTVYPVVVHPLCQAMDREAAYVRFIVAYNWAKIIQTAVYLPTVVIVWLGVLPESLAVLLQTAVYVGLVLGYQWFVTRTALEIKGWAATGLVALDFFVSLILGLMLVGMLQ